MPILVALCLLPYFQATPLGTDVQPYAMIAIVGVLCVHAMLTSRLPIHSVSFMMSILLLGFGAFSGSMSATISLAMLPVFVDFLSRLDRKDILLGAKIATVVLLMGLVLNVVSESLLTNLVSNYRTSALRGLNSFTSEPSYLGLTGFTLALIFHALKARWTWFAAAAVLTLASGSATGILPFGILFALTFLRGWHIILFPLGLLALWFGLQYASTWPSRFGMLASTLIHSPDLLLMDVSFSNRILRSFGPLIVAYQDWFVPHGLSGDIAISIDVLSDRADNSVKRLSSLISVFTYGLGFLSLPMIIVYLRSTKGSLQIWVALFYLSVANISTATPYLWLALALPVLLKREEKQQSDQAAITQSDRFRLRLPS